MFFASDNAGPVHPEVLKAMTAAGDGHALGYGNEPLMRDVREMIRDAFEAPEAMVQLVATGTAANAILLATLANPWDAVFCTPMAHIHEDECNAPEFYSGAKLTLVEAIDAKMTPDTLRRAILAEETRGVHGPQRGPVSITSVTEKGTLYTPDEIAAICEVAHGFGLPVHLDGARFANAMAALGCTAAEMTWKAGVDAVSFGGTKNGCFGVEACILFDPAKAWEFELRRKRGGHLVSRHRMLSGQMAGYLTDGLWTRLARQANEAAARLSAGLEAAGVALDYRCEANIIFFTAPAALHRKLQEGGAVYYIMSGDLPEDPDAPATGRLVCDWSVTEAQVDAFLALLA